MEVKKGRNRILYGFTAYIPPGQFIVFISSALFAKESSYRDSKYLSRWKHFQGVLEENASLSSFLSLSHNQV